ncbi:hypothetical protein SGPA1_10282 [Streptomyces misionensis JCM 4497]
MIYRSPFRRRAPALTCEWAGSAGSAGFVRQTWGAKTEAKDGYADHTCHRDAQLVERHRTGDLAGTRRREGRDDRYGGEARRPSAAGTAAPRVLGVPLRRAGPAAAPAAGARQVPLPGRVVQHLLRAPLPRRVAVRGGGPAHVRGAGRVPLAAGRGRHRALQPPGPGLGPGGAGVQPPVRRPGADAARAGPGGGRRDRLRDGGRAGAAACPGHVLGLVHDRAGRGPSGDQGADGPRGRLVNP